MIPHIPQQKVQIEHFCNFVQGCVNFMNYFVALSQNHKKKT